MSPQKVNLINNAIEGIKTPFFYYDSYFIKVNILYREQI